MNYEKDSEFSYENIGSIKNNIFTALKKTKKNNINAL